MADLTTKQKLFCDTYLSNGFNASDAAIKAGYSEKTAYAIGNENLKKLEIREYINKELDFHFSSAKELQKQLIDECKKYAFMSDQEMEMLQVKASDKKQYLDMLFKYLGLYSEKQEVNHTTIDKDGNKKGIDYTMLSTEALKEIVRASKD